MIEVECKLPIENTDNIKSKLTSLGFSLITKQKELDTYYDNSATFIRDNDSALRIRTVTNLDTLASVSQINFKGKKYDNVSMTRPEFETVVDNSEMMNKILNSLGFYNVEPKVIKTRLVYKLDEMTACLDYVENLGDFLELEIIVANESEKAAAISKIEATLKCIGYTISDTTTTSYLSALQMLQKGD